MIKYLKLLKNDMSVIVLLSVLIGIYLIIIILFYQVPMILEQYLEYKALRCKNMQSFYPIFRKHLFELKLYMKDVEENPISCSLCNAAQKYIAYKTAPEEYRKVFDYEKDRLDEFLAAMDRMSRKLTEIHSFLADEGVPGFWRGHPFLKRRLRKMIAKIRRYACLWNIYCENEELVSPEVYQYEMNSFHKRKKMRMDYKEIEKSLTLLDHWFLKY